MRGIPPRSLEGDKRPAPGWSIHPFFLRPLAASWFLLLAAPIWAGQGGGLNPEAYLDLDAGGSPSAMAGAAVASRGDVSSAFWNPAGLTGLRGFQVENQYAFLPLGQQWNNLFLATQFARRFFCGLTFLYYSAGGDLEARQGPSLGPDGIFGDTEMAFYLSLAGKLDPRWSLGGNLKFFVNKLAIVSATGVGGDLGLQCRLSPETTLGFMARDIYSSIGYSNTNGANEVLPLVLRAGLSHLDPPSGVRGEVDMEWNGNTGLKPRLGLEWGPSQEVVLRGGAWWEPGTGFADFSVGLGFKVPAEGSGAELDYTLSGDRWAGGGILHQMSVKGTFL